MLLRHTERGHYIHRCRLYNLETTIACPSICSITTSSCSLGQVTGLCEASLNARIDTSILSVRVGMSSFPTMQRHGWPTADSMSSAFGTHCRTSLALSSLSRFINPSRLACPKSMNPNSEGLHELKLSIIPINAHWHLLLLVHALFSC